MVAFINSNGGLWIALASQYGDEEDRGAYIASALNDGPFFTLLFLGLSGLGAIPWQALVAAIVPFIIGFILGNLDERFAKMMEPTASITIPFFAFALGAGIDLRSLAVGGATGLILGVLVSVVTGYLGVLGYRLLLGERSSRRLRCGDDGGECGGHPGHRGPGGPPLRSLCRGGCRPDRRGGAGDGHPHAPPSPTTSTSAW